MRRISGHCRGTPFKGGYLKINDISFVHIPRHHHPTIISSDDATTDTPNLHFPLMLKLGYGIGEYRCFGDGYTAVCDDVIYEGGIREGWGG